MILELDHDDEKFFKNLLEGEEPELPPEVLNGSTRMKIKRNMVVNNEIIDKFLQENFLDPDDVTLENELKSYAESLGFDAEEMAEYLRKIKVERFKKVSAPMDYPVIPQLQRQEARKRLSETTKRCAKILLNRLKVSIEGHELQFKIAPGKVTGNNFVAAVQLINYEVNKRLNIASGQRSTLRTQDYKKAIDEMNDIVNVLTKKFKKGENDEKR